MQVNPSQFEAVFTTRAYKRVHGLPEVEAAPSAPRDGFVGTLRRWIGWRPSASVLQAQNKMTLQAACQALGLPGAMLLAQEVGVALEDGKNGEGIAYGQRHTESQDPVALEKRDRLWSRIVAVSGTSVSKPSLLQDAAGQGRFVGQSIFHDARDFVGMPDEVALFCMAHEVGHVEHQDGSRKVGAQALANSLGSSYDSSALYEARQTLNRDMEFAADKHAAEVAAKAGCDPLPILLDLLALPSTAEHPPGLERARKVRQVMAEHGMSVSEEAWDKAVLATSVLRDERQRISDDEMALRFTWENLR